jgi:hypothetical protein
MHCAFGTNSIRREINGSECLCEIVGMGQTEIMKVFTLFSCRALEMCSAPSGPMSLELRLSLVSVCIKCAVNDRMRSWRCYSVLS